MKLELGEMTELSNLFLTQANRGFASSDLVREQPITCFAYPDGRDDDFGIVSALITWQLGHSLAYGDPRLQQAPWVSIGSLLHSCLHGI